MPKFKVIHKGQYIQEAGPWWLGWMILEFTEPVTMSDELAEQIVDELDIQAWQGEPGHSYREIPAFYPDKDGRIILVEQSGGVDV